MNQLIPRYCTAPLKVGDRVQLAPEWYDPAEDTHERFVIEAPDDSTWVRIRTVIPGFVFHPTDWIEADQLILTPQTTNNQQPTTNNE